MTDDYRQIIHDCIQKLAHDQTFKLRELLDPVGQWPPKFTAPTTLGRWFRKEVSRGGFPEVEHDFKDPENHHHYRRI